MSNLLTIEVDGDEGLQQVFTRLAHLDTERILDEGAAILFNNMRTRFLQELNPDLQQWPKSKAAIKRANSGRGGGTLYDTGRLFHSLQLHSEGEGTRSISTDVPYGKFHMTGTIHMPQRVFLGFNETDADYMANLVAKRIAETIEGNS